MGKVRNTLSKVRKQLGKEWNTLIKVRNKFSKVRNTMVKVRNTLSKVRNRLSNVRGKLGKVRNTLSIAQEIYESAGVIYFVTSAFRILPVCLVGWVVKKLQEKADINMNKTTSLASILTVDPFP